MSVSMKPSSRKIHQGLTQDSVLASCLFVLNIYDLNKIPEMSGRLNKRLKNPKHHNRVGGRHQAIFFQRHCTSKDSNAR